MVGPSARAREQPIARVIIVVVVLLHAPSPTIQRRARRMHVRLQRAVQQRSLCALCGASAVAGTAADAVHTSQFVHRTRARAAALPLRRANRAAAGVRCTLLLLLLYVVERAMHRVEGSAVGVRRALLLLYVVQRALHRIEGSAVGLRGALLLPLCVVE